MNKLFYPIILLSLLTISGALHAQQTVPPTQPQIRYDHTAGALIVEITYANNRPSNSACGGFDGYLDFVDISFDNSFTAFSMGSHALSPASAVFAQSRNFGMQSYGDITFTFSTSSDVTAYCATDGSNAVM